MPGINGKRVSPEAINFFRVLHERGLAAQLVPTDRVDEYNLDLAETGRLLRAVFDENGQIVNEAHVEFLLILVDSPLLTQVASVAKRATTFLRTTSSNQLQAQSPKTTKSPYASPSAPPVSSGPVGILRNVFELVRKAKTQAFMQVYIGFQQSLMELNKKGAEVESVNRTEPGRETTEDIIRKVNQQVQQMPAEVAIGFQFTSDSDTNRLGTRLNAAKDRLNQPTKGLVEKVLRQKSSLESYRPGTLAATSPASQDFIKIVQQYYRQLTGNDDSSRVFVEVARLKWVIEKLTPLVNKAGNNASYDERAIFYFLVEKNIIPPELVTSFAAYYPWFDRNTTGYKRYKAGDKPAKLNALMQPITHHYSDLWNKSDIQSAFAAATAEGVSDNRCFYREAQTYQKVRAVLKRLSQMNGEVEVTTGALGQLLTYSAPYELVSAEEPQSGTAVMTEPSQYNKVRGNAESAPIDSIEYVLQRQLQQLISSFWSHTLPKDDLNFPNVLPTEPSPASSSGGSSSNDVAAATSLLDSDAGLSSQRTWRTIFDRKKSTVQREAATHTTLLGGLVSEPKKLDDFIEQTILFLSNIQPAKKGGFFSTGSSPAEIENARLLPYREELIDVLEQLKLHHFGTKDFIAALKQFLYTVNQIRTNGITRNELIPLSQQIVAACVALTTANSDYYREKAGQERHSVLLIGVDAQQAIYTPAVVEPVRPVSPGPATAAAGMPSSPLKNVRVKGDSDSPPLLAGNGSPSASPSTTVTRADVGVGSRTSVATRLFADDNALLAAPVRSEPVPVSGNASSSVPVRSEPVPASGEASSSAPVRSEPVPASGEASSSAPVRSDPVPASGNASSSALAASEDGLVEQMDAIDAPLHLQFSAHYERLNRKLASYVYYNTDDRKVFLTETPGIPADWTDGQIDDFEFAAYWSDAVNPFAPSKKQYTEMKALLSLYRTYMASRPAQTVLALPDGDTVVNDAQQPQPAEAQSASPSPIDLEYLQGLFANRGGSNWSEEMKQLFSEVELVANRQTNNVTAVLFNALTQERHLSTLQRQALLVLYIGYRDQFTCYAQINGRFYFDPVKINGLTDESLFITEWRRKQLNRVGIFTVEDFKFAVRRLCTALNSEAPTKPAFLQPIIDKTVQQAGTPVLLLDKIKADSTVDYELPDEIIPTSGDASSPELGFSKHFLLPQPAQQVVDAVSQEIEGVPQEVDAAPVAPAAIADIAVTVGDWQAISFSERWTTSKLEQQRKAVLALVHKLDTEHRLNFRTLHQAKGGEHKDDLYYDPKAAQAIKAVRKDLKERYPLMYRLYRLQKEMQGILTTRSFTVVELEKSRFIGVLLLAFELACVKPSENGTTLRLVAADNIDDTAFNRALAADRGYFSRIGIQTAADFKCFLKDYDPILYDFSASNKSLPSFIPRELMALWPRSLNSVVGIKEQFNLIKIALMVLKQKGDDAAPINVTVSNNRQTISFKVNCDQAETALRLIKNIEEADYRFNLEQLQQVLAPFDAAIRTSKAVDQNLSDLQRTVLTRTEAPYYHLVLQNTDQVTKGIQKFKDDLMSIVVSRTNAILQITSDFSKVDEVYATEFAELNEKFVNIKQSADAFKQCDDPTNLFRLASTFVESFDDFMRYLNSPNFATLYEAQASFGWDLSDVSEDLERLNNLRIKNENQSLAQQVASPLLLQASQSPNPMSFLTADAFNTTVFRILEAIQRIDINAIPDNLRVQNQPLAAINQIASYLGTAAPQPETIIIRDEVGRLKDAYEGLARILQEPNNVSLEQAIEALNAFTAIIARLSSLHLIDWDPANDVHIPACLQVKKSSFDFTLKSNEEQQQIRVSLGKIAGIATADPTILIESPFTIAPHAVAGAEISPRQAFIDEVKAQRHQYDLSINDEPNAVKSQKRESLDALKSRLDSGSLSRRFLRQLPFLNPRVNDGWVKQTFFNINNFGKSHTQVVLEDKAPAFVNKTHLAERVANYLDYAVNQVKTSPKKSDHHLFHARFWLVLSDAIERNSGILTTAFGYLEMNGQKVLQIKDIAQLAAAVERSGLIQRDPVYRQLGIDSTGDYALLLSHVNQQLRLYSSKANSVASTRYIPPELTVIGQELLVQVDEIRQPQAGVALVGGAVGNFTIDFTDARYTAYKNELHANFTSAPARYKAEAVKYAALVEIEAAHTAGSLNLRVLDGIEEKYKKQGLYQSTFPSRMKKWRHSIEQTLKNNNPVYAHFYMEWKQLQQQRNKSISFAPEHLLWQQFVYGMINGLEQGWIKKTNTGLLYHEYVTAEAIAGVSGPKQQLYKGEPVRQPNDYISTIIPLVNDTCVKLAAIGNRYNPAAVPSFLTRERWDELRDAMQIRAQVLQMEH